MIYVIPISLIIFVVITSYCDLRYKKIYNWLTIPFWIMGIIVNTGITGISGLQISLLGAVVGFIILLIPYILGWIGGGDVKLLIAVGAWIGPGDIAYSTVYGLIFMGIGSIIYLIIKRRLRKFLKQMKFIFLGCGKMDEIEVTGKLPLGVFLGLGILLQFFKNYIQLL